MAHVLIVDDETNIRNAIREYCEFKQYKVTEAADGMEAVKLCREQDFDVIVMDVMLPKLNGFSACREILSEKDIPIIMLSARGDEYDKLFGFELGIEDYVVKPFSPMELMARINVVLRRHNRIRSAEEDQAEVIPEEILRYRGLTIDSGSRHVMVDGNQVYLPAKALELLLYLVKNRGQMIPREQLIRDVWGYSYVMGTDRTLDTHVKMIRSSLGAYRHLLVTQRNVGYKFEVPNE